VAEREKKKRRRGKRKREKKEKEEGLAIAWPTELWRCFVWHAHICEDQTLFRVARAASERSYAGEKATAAPDDGEIVVARVLVRSASACRCEASASTMAGGQ